MAPSIPDRWIPYKACGKVIEGTRFICFKVPLRKAVQQGKKEIKEIWDIKALLDAIPNLGAVIDLTNTARYYNPADLKNAGILHRKILMPGRIIPPEAKVKEFMNAVDEFLGKNGESIIGVHCTHGLNRTGYMVCRYMRDRMGIDAKDAIRKFEIARGYKIERENYIAHLTGQKPPPPDVGQDTEVKPVEDTEEINGYASPKARSIESPSRHSSNRRHRERERSWRDECVRGRDNSPGRHVRHPYIVYNSSWRNGRKDSGRLNTRYQQNKSGFASKSRNDRCSSSDSDRSYDFRHDY